ncbi:hypothetical protein EMIT0180MI3_21185 [Priestia megaterium]
MELKFFIFISINIALVLLAFIIGAFVMDSLGSTMTNEKGSQIRECLFHKEEVLNIYN